MTKVDSKHRPMQLGRSDTVPASAGMRMNDPRRNISAPLNDVQPEQFSKFEHRSVLIGKPDLAHHPAMMGERF